jgi:hypothetical protein
MRYGTAWGGDDRPSDEPVGTPPAGFAFLVQPAGKA